MITKTELLEILQKTSDVTTEDLEICARFVRCYSNTDEWKLAKQLHEMILKNYHLEPKGIRTDNE